MRDEPLNRVTTIREHRIGGTLYKPGDEYSIPTRYAKLLVGIKKVKLAEDDQMPVMPGYHAPEVETRALEPEADAEPVKSTKVEPMSTRTAPTRTRKYSRRDMKADE